jgi:hypothetical protein
VNGPRPPAGSIALPLGQLEPTRGENARWRHTHTLPAVELSLRVAGQHGGYRPQDAHVQIRHVPVGGPIYTRDPGELRQIAWLYLAAAHWLDRQQPGCDEDAEPDPQTTIYDHLQEATP